MSYSLITDELETCSESRREVASAAFLCFRSPVSFFVLIPDSLDFNTSSPLRTLHRATRGPLHLIHPSILLWPACSRQSHL